MIRTMNTSSQNWQNGFFFGEITTKNRIVQVTWKDKNGTCHSRYISLLSREKRIGVFSAHQSFQSSAFREKAFLSFTGLKPLRDSIHNEMRNTFLAKTVQSIFFFARQERFMFRPLVVSQENPLHPH